MDLSWLKWPVIILVVAGALWLVSSGGVGFMFNKYTQGQPGVDTEADVRNEAGLTRLGSFLMKTLRYEKAEEVLRAAIDRYPEGTNTILNQYRLVELLEKRDNGRGAAEMLSYLIRINAHEQDDRVPINDTLELRRQKLVEMYELNQR